MPLLRKVLLVIPPDILKLTLAHSHCPPYAAGAACVRPFHQPSNNTRSGALTTMDGCDESQCVNSTVSVSHKPKNGFETNRKSLGPLANFTAARSFICIRMMTKWLMNSLGGLAFHLRNTQFHSSSCTVINHRPCRPLIIYMYMHCVYIALSVFGWLGVCE